MAPVRKVHDQVMLPTAEHMMNAHYEWMRAGGYTANTIDIATWVLAAAHTALPRGLARAFPEELASWLASGVRSASTRATYRAHLVRFYRWANDPADPWMTYDPSVGLRRPRVRKRLPRPGSDDEVRAAISQTPMPFRLHCRLAAYAGLRCIEVARLERGHITASSIYVHGKGDKVRMVPTHRLIWELVESLPDGPVTAKCDGRPATATWVSHATREHMHRVGVVLSMHRLRHWFGTNIQRRYRDMRVTQELLGHESPVSTVVYTQVADESLRAAADMLPDLTGR